MDRINPRRNHNIAAQNFSVILDSLWNIIAIRFMFQHNAKEFLKFRDIIIKYFGKCGIAKVCCCLCLCTNSETDSEQENEIDENQKKNNDDHDTNNNEETIISRTTASKTNQKKDGSANQDEDSVL